MITIKKLCRFEKYIWTQLITTIFDHKILSFITVTLLSLFTAGLLFFILMLALIGGVQVEQKWVDMHESGEFTDEIYSNLQLFLRILNFDLNYFGFLAILLTIIPIGILIYWIYKWYLQYKHDNL